ncbi:MAG TPA: cation diffusion facilitator family transporter [Usitatibacter sp.]|nr:cation diffusion facilitator family transporter [Usitatibacter sp.]
MIPAPHEDRHARHDEGHRHGHARHGHHHAPLDPNRAFAIGVALNLGFVVAEVAFGIAADSLALLADAGHNFSDVLGLLFAWGAAALATRKPSSRFTYGLRGSTILAALANAMLLLLATGGIVWEAIGRLQEPAPVQSTTVIWVAAAGVAVNAATALMFVRGRKHDLNIRGAFLHMAADALVSVGVVVAGFVMLRTGWLWLDPAASLAIGLVILAGTWQLLRESVQLALHAVPEGVDPVAVRGHLAGLPGVAEIHDLHIWGMSTTETALTVHLVMPGGHPGDDFLCRVCDEMHDRFGIGHSTLQVETASGSAPCALAPDHVV